MRAASRFCRRVAPSDMPQGDANAQIFDRVHQCAPELSNTFLARVDACRDQEAIRYALADLNAFLTSLSAGELLTAVSGAPTSALTEFAANYVAAMVEQACNRAAVPPPPWTRSVTPLREPYFGSALNSLRLYLLTHSPPPFRNRNIFIDSSIGGQV